MAYLLASVVETVVMGGWWVVVKSVIGMQAKKLRVLVVQKLYWNTG